MASGDAVPGVPGATFASVGTPAINAAGQMAFRGTFNTGASGIVAGPSAGLNTVVRSGVSTPQGATTYAGFDDPIISDGGAIAVMATIAGPGVTFANDRVVVAGPSGSLQLWARTGSNAPGTFGDETFATFDTIRLGAGGAVAIFGTMDGEFVDTSNNLGIWSGLAPAGLQLAARSGDLVGVVPGTLYISLGIPSLNASGQLAFSALIAGSGVNTNNDQLVLRGAPGALSVLLREGNQAAGAAAGVRYAAFGSPSINAAARVALSGNLRGTGVTAFNDTAAWTNSGGTWVQIVRAGDAAPSIPGAGISIPGFPRVNSAGRVVLLSALTGAAINPSNDLALWTDSGGVFRLVAHKGDQATGLAAGVNVGGFAGAVINAQGNVLYKVTLAGAGVNAGNNTALYLWTPAGNELVARTGTSVVVRGAARTYSALGAHLDSGNQDGRPSALSDDGTIVFGATFTDGTSAVMATGGGSACVADVAQIGGAPIPDGQYTVDDIITFFNAFSDGSLVADVAQIGGEPGADGQLTVDDIITFVNAFGDGCN